MHFYNLIKPGILIKMLTSGHMTYISKYGNFLIIIIIILFTVYN